MCLYVGAAVCVCVCMLVFGVCHGCLDNYLSCNDINACPALPSQSVTLWIELGGLPEVHQVLMEGMKTVPKSTWLQVVPQLIACIDSPKNLVRNLIHSLLVGVDKQHLQVGAEGRGGEVGEETVHLLVSVLGVVQSEPSSSLCCMLQAMIYPLTVAAKLAGPIHIEAANRILSSLLDHSSQLVQQARIVSEELIAAVLWGAQRAGHAGRAGASALHHLTHTDVHFGDVQNSISCKCLPALQYYLAVRL